MRRLLLPDARALETFCDDWFRAWTGNRPDDLLAFYAADAFYADPARPDGIADRAKLRAYFAKLLAVSPEMAWTREALWPVEGGFIVKWTARIPVPGGTLVERGMDLVLMRDGLIARNEVYFDRSRWLAALGR